jgi:hypothetical protein
MPRTQRERLTPEELEQVRQFIEDGDIEEVSDEMRALVEKHWPWLLHKLPLRTVH